MVDQTSFKPGAHKIETGAPPHEVASNCRSTLAVFLPELRLADGFSVKKQRVHSRLSNHASLEPCGDDLRRKGEVFFGVPLPFLLRSSLEQYRTQKPDNQVFGSTSSVSRISSKDVRNNT